MHKWKPDERNPDAPETPAPDRGLLARRPGRGWLDVGRRSHARAAARAMTTPATKKRVGAALTCLLEWVQNDVRSGSFAAAEMDGAIIVIARGDNAHELRQWVYARNGKPQLVKNRYDIRATTKREAPPALTETD